MRKLIFLALAVALAFPLLGHAQSDQIMRATVMSAYDLDGEAADNDQVIAATALVDNGTSVANANWTILAQPDTCHLLDLTIVDTVPIQLRILSAAGPSVQTIVGNVVSWRVPSLDIGATVKAFIDAKAKDEDLDAVVVNTAVADCWTRPVGGMRRPPVSGSHTIMLTPICVVRVFPNPYKPSAAARGTLKFAGLADGSMVRIFTMAGAEVRHLSGVVRHRLEWDGRNKEGTPVAAGVYLYTMEIPDGRGGKRWVKGKFGLVR